MLLLGIESSCDDTAAAVVADGRKVLASVVVSQAAEHSVYGGVVPEIAGRSHLRAILPVINQALLEAGTKLEEVDAVAVTRSPGLIGSLLVGLSMAKGIAFARGIPIVCVDHLAAHVYAATMERSESPYPCLSLIVSGGHTCLLRVESALEMAVVAQTRDDAAGEAFDKVAWLLGCPYPGGPSVSALAAGGNPEAINFPRYHSDGGELAFSFSGLKTAVLYHLRGQDARAATPPPEAIRDRADIAASFQEAVVDQLVHLSIRGLKQERLDRLLVVGGVACNRRLRAVMGSAMTQEGFEVWFPSPAYCTDNAAMVAGLGHEHLQAGLIDDLETDASARTS